MGNEFWKNSPFEEDSIFHPSWEEKQKEKKLKNYKGVKIIQMDAVPNYPLLGFNPVAFPFSLSKPKNYIISSDNKYVIVAVKVVVNLNGRADKVEVSLNKNTSITASRSITSNFQYVANFNVKVGRSFARIDKYNSQEFIFTAKVRDVFTKEISDTMSVKTQIDTKGKVNETFLYDPNIERKSVSDLKPSDKFYLYLKNLEGLGYNVIYDENKEVSKILPYDDGGEMGKGYATIGYGHLIDYKPFNKNNPSHAIWKDGISLDQAETLLKKDVEKKMKLLIKGIKVKLYQNEYDALLLSIYNGGYGKTLESTINKGVENITEEEIFKAFLIRRFSNKKELRGLIKRRALEADIFVNNNWNPYPSEKFKNGDAYIKAYKKFITSGILPLILFFLLTLMSCSQKKTNELENLNVIEQLKNRHKTIPLKIKQSELHPTKINKEINLDEYQYNELLFDANDELLLSIDTILYFSDKKFLYEITINKENVKIITTKWTDAPNNIIRTTQVGYQKKGFIYILNPKTNEYSLQYKIIYNKGLFSWREDNHWYLINSGDY